MSENEIFRFDAVTHVVRCTVQIIRFSLWAGYNSEFVCLFAEEHRGIITRTLLDMHLKAYYREKNINKPGHRHYV